MVVDLLEKSRVNVRDLILPEVISSGEPFDQSKDILSSDLENVLGFLKDQVQDAEQENTEKKRERIFGLLLATRILFPEAIEQLQLADSFWVHLAEDVAKYKGDDVTYLSKTSSIKAIDPQKLSLFSTPEDLKQRRSKLSSEIENAFKRRLPGVTNWLFYDKCLFRNSSIRQEILEFSKTGLEEKAKEAIKRDDWGDYAGLAFNYKFLFSQPLEPVQIPSNCFFELRRTMQKARNGNNWEEFLQQACEFKILAAQEIRVTEQGLELIMPKPQQSFSDGRVSLPAIRRF